jgi:hypothetical protein
MLFITAGLPQRSKKQVIQWNPVILRILSSRERREEAKREEFKEKTTKQPLRQRHAKCKNEFLCIDLSKVSHSLKFDSPILGINGCGMSDQSASQELATPSQFRQHTSAGKTRPKTGHVTSMPASAVTLSRNA